MSARSKARKRALDVIYAAEMRGRSALDQLTEQNEDSTNAVNPYVVELVQGLSDHAERIDEVLGRYAQGWSLERMPAVDRNVLRLGAYEVLYVDDVPDAVAVSEAVKLVKELSTDESPGFVNGVLGNIVRDRDSILG